MISHKENDEHRELVTQFGATLPTSGGLPTHERKFTLNSISTKCLR